MIPGSKPKIEPTAKVRIGETRVSKGGKDYPAALDYFICPHTAFTEVAGEKPKTIRISFVHDTIEDGFSTGLEWWIKDKNQKPLLACYTKDGGSSPVALRMDKMLDAGQEAVGPPRGNGRLPIACAARECPHFKTKKCKPMGRLVFVLDGGTHVYQIDTKAWNSIEQIEGALRQAQARGPLNAPGRLFDLSVEIVVKGENRFPVMSIQEVEVLVMTPEQIATYEALAALGRLVHQEADEDSIKRGIAVALDHVSPGWRENEKIVQALKGKPVLDSAKGLLEKQL